MSRPSLSCCKCLDVFDQVSEFDSEAVSDLCELHYSDVVQTSLNSGEKGPVKFCPLCQLLLCEAKPHPFVADCFTKRFAGIKHIFSIRNSLEWVHSIYAMYRPSHQKWSGIVFEDMKQAEAPDTRRRLGIILGAAAIVLVVIAVWGAFQSHTQAEESAERQRQERLEQFRAIDARVEKQDQTKEEAQPPEPDPVTQEDREILSALPDFHNLLEMPTGDDMLASYSPAFQKENDLVSDRLKDIHDSDLRSDVQRRMWDGFYQSHDRRTLLRDACVRWGNESSVEMKALLQAHRSWWFEIGPVDFLTMSEHANNGQVVVRSIESPTSLISLKGEQRFEVPIEQLDTIFSKFSGVTRREVADEMSKRRDSENIRICEQLPAGCSVSSDEDAQRAAVQRLRAERIVLVGRGDVVAHTLSELRIIDFPTGLPLGNLDATRLKGAYTWKEWAPYGSAPNGACFVVAHPPV